MYTNVTKERTLEAQLADPKNAEEFARLLTHECLEYMNRQGESFEIHADITSSLSQPFTGASTPGSNAKTAEQLKGNLHYLTQKFYSSISRERIKGAYQIALEEWFNRMVSPFLDKNCREHGDVYSKKNLDIAVWKVINRLLEQVEQLGVQVEILTNAQKVNTVPVFEPKTLHTEGEGK